MEYNVSDIQDLLCLVLIILRMAILKEYILWDSKPGFVLGLFFNFLPKSRPLFLQNCSYKKVYDFFKLGFTQCKAEQPLQGMKLQEKEAQKEKEYRKYLKKESTVNRCLLILDLTSFR